MRASSHWKSVPALLRSRTSKTPDHKRAAALQVEEHIGAPKTYDEAPQQESREGVRRHGARTNVARWPSRFGWARWHKSGPSEGPRANKSRDVADTMRGGEEKRLTDRMLRHIGA